MVDFYTEHLQKSLRTKKITLIRRKQIWKKKRKLNEFPFNQAPEIEHLIDTPEKGDNQWLWRLTLSEVGINLVGKL